MDIGPGDWVEATEDVEPQWSDFSDRLVRGVVYRVREVAPGELLDGSWEDAVFLCGQHEDCGWDPEYLRPIYRPKADLIEQLSRPIVRQPEKVDA